MRNCDEKIKDKNINRIRSLPLTVSRKSLLGSGCCIHCPKLLFLIRQKSWPNPVGEELVSIADTDSWFLVCFEFRLDQLLISRDKGRIYYTENKLRVVLDQVSMPAPHYQLFTPDDWLSVDRVYPRLPPHNRGGFGGILLECHSLPRIR